MAWITVACVALTLGQEASFQPPEAWDRMVAYRRALVTGLVEGALEWNGSTRGRLYRNWTWRFAGPDVICVNRGDESGVILRDEDGNPAAGYGGAVHTLKRNGNTWEHQEREPRAAVGPSGAMPSVGDVRTLGLRPGFTMQGLDEAIWQEPGNQPSARRYSERREGRLYVVTAQLDRDAKVEWWIDPERGWQPVRVLSYSDGELYAQAHSALAQHDGVWFPSAVQYYVRTHRNGKQPVWVVTIDAAEFNRPEHPSRFTPEHIGIVPFVTGVTRYDSDKERVASGVYDGERFLSSRDLAAQRHSDAKGAAPESAGDTGPGNASDYRYSQEYDSIWQEYTRAFIAKYRLQEEQAQRAWMICQDCETRADAHLARQRGALNRIAADLDRLAQQVDKAGSTSRREQLLGERAVLLKPIRLIFERQLKPRLQRLPTREQRALADTARDAKDP